MSAPTAVTLAISHASALAKARVFRISTGANAESPVGWKLSARWLRAVDVVVTVFPLCVSATARAQRRRSFAEAAENLAGVLSTYAPFDAV
ncbi:MAG: hypothetical protein E7C78_01700 [Dermabacter sp.]|nr:hypothetical protein [Dermabacter sp.]